MFMKIPSLIAVIAGLFLFVSCDAGTARAAEDAAKAKQTSRRKVMTEAEASAYGAPRTVDIEIQGRDDKGKWISHGAGSILHEAGYILTCEHITAHGERQSVILADGTVYPYTVVARAGGSYDTAILKIKPTKPLKTVELGHSADLAKEEKVIVIGNPSGRRHTVTTGVVEKTTCGGGTQIHVGQSDVGPGDSGGPVFNLRGEQVALVHTKIFTLKRAGRHIRVDHIRDAFAKVFMNEKRYKQTIGLQVDCQSDQARVITVKKGSPAAVAGIKPGDVVTRFGSMDIRIGPHYVLALMDRVTADPIKITLQRDGKKVEVSVRPQPRAASK
jgi:S1-C subfamily serine protease